MEGGKWGLVIIAAAFFIQVFAFGLSGSIGVYNIEFLNYFDQDTVGVSLVSSLNLAFFLGSGPLVSLLIRKMSYRKVALLGSTMITAGIAVMPLLPYIPAYCIFYGVVTGMGCCLVYIPSHVLSGLYYKRYQSLSTGIATSGSGLGGAIMPIVFSKLIEEYGWKQSLYVAASLMLHLFVFSALLRAPPPFQKSRVKKKAEHLCLESHTAFISQENEYKENEVQSNFIIEETMSQNQSTSAEMSKEWKKLQHLYLFTDLGFDLYFISSILWNASAATVLSFGPDFTNKRGISILDSAWLLAIFGFGDFFGAIIGAVLGNVWTKHRLAQYVVACILFGVCLMVFPFGQKFGDFVAIMVFGGLAFGVILGLLIVVLIDLIGICNLGDGMGYIMLANGIGAFIGPFLSGYIHKVYGSYDLAFYINGLFGVLAGFSMLFIPCIKYINPTKKAVGVSLYSGKQEIEVHPQGEVVALTTVQ